MTCLVIYMFIKLRLDLLVIAQLCTIQHIAEWYIN